MEAKKYLDIESWNRKGIFHHFLQLTDPTFGMVVNIDVTNAYNWAKNNNESFFVRYFYACMIAVNSIENFSYRIEEKKVAVYDVVHPSTTIARTDNTFGFAFFHFTEDYQEFKKRFQAEKDRIESTTSLLSEIYSENCVYTSAVPWVSFISHKEPFGSKTDSIPRLSFGKFINENGKKIMPVAINVNHALVDGYHIGQFFERFQQELNKNS